MIHFFRDILDGPLYIVIVVISIIIIMGIIGFIMERYQLAKEDVVVVKDVKVGETQTANTLVISSNKDSSKNQAKVELTPPESKTGQGTLTIETKLEQNQNPLPNTNPVQPPTPIPTVEIASVGTTPPPTPAPTIPIVPTIVETKPINKIENTKPAVLELSSNDVLENKPVDASVSQVATTPPTTESKLSIESASLNQVEVVQTTVQPESTKNQATNVAPVIDFGSTSDVDVAK